MALAFLMDVHIYEGSIDVYAFMAYVFGGVPMADVAFLRKVCLRTRYIWFDAVSDVDGFLITNPSAIRILNNTVLIN